MTDDKYKMYVRLDCTTLTSDGWKNIGNDDLVEVKWDEALEYALGVLAQKPRPIE